jgi:hypothetical protein
LTFAASSFPNNWRLSRLWVKACVVLTFVAFLGYIACLLASILTSIVIWGSLHNSEGWREVWPGLWSIFLWNHVPGCFFHDQGIYIALDVALPAAAFLALRAFGTWDLMLDVTSYAGHTRRRRVVLQGVAEIIRKIDSARDGAPLILVGHSLGSVLLSHAVPVLTGGTALMVTCGSPINLMAKAFPPIVYSSDKLAAEILAPMGILQWVNFYHDADYIGRSLRVTSSAIFREASIGDGGHTGYFSDVSFWTAVLNLVFAQPSFDPEQLPALPAAGSPDIKELSNLCDLAWMSGLVGIMSAVIDAYIGCTFILPGGPAPLLCISLPLVLVLIAISVASSTGAVGVLLLLQCRWNKFNEVPISEFRFWRMPLIGP